MKNMIIGKNGFVAKQLLQRKSYQTTSSEVGCKKSVYLDLTNPKIFDYSALDEQTTIVFLAAVSSPDECNNNYNEAYNINVVGTIYFIKEAIKRGTKVLFFSSDVIYGNTTELVNENSKTNPFGNYAKMKDEVEKTFENEKNFKVFRLSYVLSSEDKYLKYLKSCIDKNEVAEVFHPFDRKVVYIEDLLLAIENLIEQWNRFDNQKFNICGIETISRKDIANFYNEAVGNKLKYSITEPNEKFWQARPKDINMSSKYFENLIGKKPTKIKDAVKRIIKEES